VPAGQHRKPPKFLSSGRHAAPSPAAAVMQKAGKTVPTVVLASALTVAAQSPRPDNPEPARPAATAVYAARPGAPATAALDQAAVIARPAAPASAVRYTVRPGDTLSGIAFRFYGQARAWQYLYQVNQAELTSPNLIFPGQVLSIPPHAPASLGGLAVTTAADPRPASAASGPPAAPAAGRAPQGTLGCSALEELWREAGGTPAAEVTAASIAMAESGGRQFATGSVGERGYWQINPDHGSLSTYDALGNARAAVIISADGTNWSPWTTFGDGAYRGRC
jgi:LysM repeat protein